MANKIVNGRLVEIDDEENREFEKFRRKGYERFLQEEYKHHRKEAYPDIGDQLDALFKHFIHNKETLAPELKSIIKTWAKVKEDFPKLNGKINKDKERK
jgi:hypothetical protein